VIDFIQNICYNNIMKKYTITLEEDPETGDVVLPFPPEVLEELGWVEGDTLLWNVLEENGSWSATLTKKKD
jgi:hypothetical protein